MTSARPAHHKWGRLAILLAISLGGLIGLTYHLSGFGSRVTNPSTQSVATPSSVVQPLTEPTIDIPVQQSTAELPPKAAPTRITIKSASIDIAVSHLQMTDAEIATRVYTPPETSQGYYVKFTENEVTPFDFPGGDTIGATWIIGHSCAGLDICQTADWPFNRLSDPRLVHVGTEISVTTDAGKICYQTVATTQVDSRDAADQNIILNNAVVHRHLVLTSCYPQDIHGQNTFVIAAQEPCM